MRMRNACELRVRQSVNTLSPWRTCMLMAPAGISPVSGNMRRNSDLTFSTMWHDGRRSVYRSAYKFKTLIHSRATHTVAVLYLCLPPGRIELVCEVGLGRVLVGPLVLAHRRNHPPKPRHKHHPHVVVQFRRTRIKSTTTSSSSSIIIRMQGVRGKYRLPKIGLRARGDGGRPAVEAERWTTHGRAQIVLPVRSHIQNSLQVHCKCYITIIINLKLLLLLLLFCYYYNYY